MNGEESDAYKQHIWLEDDYLPIGQNIEQFLFRRRGSILSLSRALNTNQAQSVVSDGSDELYAQLLVSYGTVFRSAANRFTPTSRMPLHEN